MIVELSGNHDRHCSDSTPFVLGEEREKAEKELLEGEEQTVAKTNARSKSGKKRRKAAGRAAEKAEKVDSFIRTAVAKQAIFAGCSSQEHSRLHVCCGGLQRRNAKKWHVHVQCSTHGISQEETESQADQMQPATSADGREEDCESFALDPLTR